jgi:hypothetical protein
VSSNCSLMETKSANSLLRNGSEGPGFSQAA